MRTKLKSKAKPQMFLFRAFLVAIFVSVGAYTVPVMQAHGGFDVLVPRFFHDIAEMSWPGQFNFDFLCYLLMTALWLAWRHDFSAAGLAIGLGGLLLGSPYLALYLLAQSFAVNGDSAALFLGEARARRLRKQKA